MEFADLILITKTDLASEKDVERLVAILKTLNTDARIIPISHGKIDVDEVLSTGLFNFERAQQAPGWLKEMRGNTFRRRRSMELVALLTKLVGLFIPKSSIASFTIQRNTES